VGLARPGGIEEAEWHTISAELSEVDALFSKAGSFGGPRWRIEYEGVILRGVDRAGVKLMSEVRAITGAEAPTFADEIGEMIDHLGHVLVKSYRRAQMGGKVAGIHVEVEEACQRLEVDLHEVQERVIDDLRYRPPPASLAHTININTEGGPAAVAGRDVFQHVEGLSGGQMLEAMSQVRQAIEAAQVTAEQREALTERVEVIEALAKQPQPDSGLLRRLGKRLGDELLTNGVATGMALAGTAAKQWLGLP